ncbi:hypothetical protein SADUNF_Sadunf09G0107300 [Salix dunnii]|uniref:Uncharacterized protein n=1 Tax=Salix dunnii TaxID=1413687 RepID=A0A835JRG9_9ROSI|nr:hypothetical protein SADUNF_Sadunf09G0107300 [Salix dunnii]
MWGKIELVFIRIRSEEAVAIESMPPLVLLPCEPIVKDATGGYESWKVVIWGNEEAEVASMKGLDRGILGRLKLGDATVYDTSDNPPDFALLEQVQWGHSERQG